MYGVVRRGVLAGINSFQWHVVACPTPSHREEPSANTGFAA